MIDIVKQQGFEATLVDTMDDLLTLNTATKDLSDRINTRAAKSLNANDSDAIKYKPNAKSKASQSNEAVGGIRLCIYITY